jgi:chaperonin GroES
MPKDLVVNYWATSLEETERKTERISMSKRVFTERVNAGIFLDVELSDPTSQGMVTGTEGRANNVQNTTIGQDDKTTPYVILEQHTFLDLDDDGYDEPYIITIEERSRKVLRIVARFDEKSIFTDDEGNLVKIEPVEYYTKYTFIPNPDGGFYDIGFGLLLGPLNESVNTVINQLLDSGHLSVLQAGFIGKGLRLKMGATAFTPGEWKVVNATGDDIKKQIMPLPTQQPSTVLFQLLELLITSTKELASVAEIFVGKMPGQNTPATTTQETVKQGMMLFTAVYKRVYRSLAKEFTKLYRLDSIYLDPTEETKVLDDQIGQQDFEEDTYDVYPAADPAATSSQEKQAKAQMLLSLIQLGTVDPMAVTKRLLEAQEQPRPEELLPKGPPPPDPKAQLAQAKIQAIQEQGQVKQQEAQTKMQMDAQHMQMEQRSKEFDQMMAAQNTHQENQSKLVQAALDAHLKAIDARLQTAMAATAHAQKMGHAEDVHQQKLRQMAQQPVKGTDGN